jgi:integrase
VQKSGLRNIRCKQLSDWAAQRKYRGVEEDYFQTGKRSLIRFKEKSGKEKEIPVHHKLEEILDEYLKVSKLREKPETPLFPTTLGKSRELGSRPMTRFDGANLLKRRLRDAGILGDYSRHSFRATGITNYLENGGPFEVAQRIAGHADSRTTKLYDRPWAEGLARRHGADSVLSRNQMPFGN